MFRTIFRKQVSQPPRYYLYLSKTKVDMLYQQIPQSVLRSLEPEIKASIGVLQAGVKRARGSDRKLYQQVAIIDRYLQRHDRVGTVRLPERYVKDSATLRYGVVHEYADAIAFFGGEVDGKKLGLIGSASSIVGEPEYAESRHAPFYYTIQFLDSAAEKESLPESDPPYYTFSEAYEIALSATTLTASVQFLGRALHSESDVLIITPIYVSLAD